MPSSHLKRNDAVFQSADGGFTAASLAVSMCVLFLVGVVAMALRSHSYAQASPPTWTDSWNGVHSFIEFNAPGNFTDAYIQSNAWRVDLAINAGKYSAALKAGNPSLLNSIHVAAFEDAQHNFAWLRSNHPEWVLYDCARSTPLVTNDRAYAIPDFTNQDYVNFKWVTEFLPAIQAARSQSQAIVLDDAVLQNNFYSPATRVNSSHACGVYDPSGQWVQKFSPQGSDMSVSDPSFTDAVIAYFSEIRRRLHAVSPTLLLIANTDPRVVYNDPVRRANFIAAVDGVIVQDGDYAPQSLGAPGQTWLNHIHFVEDMNAAGKAVYVEQRDPGNAFASLNPDFTRFVLASYLLAKGHAAGIKLDAATNSASNIETGIYWPPEFESANLIGVPCGPMVQAAGAQGTENGLFIREHSGGVSLVNASRTTAYAAALPPGVYRDLDGNSVDSSLTVGPANAAVLLKTGDATCSNRNDTTPPNITSISTTNISTSSASIHWITDKPADSQVEFLPPCPAMGCFASLSSALTTSHTVSVSNLTPGVVYTYRVRSKDAAGNLAISPNQNLMATDPDTTPPANMMSAANQNATTARVEVANHTSTAAASAASVSGLVGQWKFDELAGSYATDSSGKNHTGTLVNFPLWTTGKSGGALQFNRMNQVNVPDGTDFSFGNGGTDKPFSVALWVNFADNNTGHLIGHFEPPSNRQWRLARVGNASSIYLILFDENAAQSNQDVQIARFVSSNFSPGNWYHLTATYDGSGSGNGIKFYINGVFMAQAGSADTGAYVAMSNVAAPLEIAGYGGAGKNFAGKLDDVRIYNRALSASDVSDIFNEAAGLPLISSITVNNITNTGATISWTTDKLADSQVDYGPTAAYGFSSTDPTPVQTHSRTLSALTANTLYHYRVRSTDAAGNTATSADLTFATQAANAPTVLYVSPNGNDSNPGTSDAPFQTIPRAQAAVRSINSAMSSDITVYLRGGTYVISNPLVFDTRDSGTNGHNVIWTSSAGERATISGGQTITGWAQVSGDLYSVPVSGLDFRQLYINGVPAIRAREPNVGSYYSVLSWSDEGRLGTKIDCEPIEEQYPIVASSNFSHFAPGTLANPQEVEFVNNLEYTQLRFHIAGLVDNGTTKKILPREASIVFAGHPSHKTNPATSPSYYFENAKEFLDAPGEWYLDRQLHVLYYMKRPGETLPGADVTAPVVERLLQIQGDGPGSPIHNIQFQGIAFEGSNWTAPSNIGIFQRQGDDRALGSDIDKLAPIPGAVHIQDATNIRFERDVFRDLGSTAVLLYSDISNTTFIGNVFQDISGSGIALEGRYGEVGFFDDSGACPVPKGNDDIPLGRVPLQSPFNNYLVHDNVIQDNYFNRVALDYQASMGIYATYVQSLTIEHNEFYDMPYSGLSVGTAGWKFVEDTEVRDNTVLYNKLHSIVTLLSDGGPIYTKSYQPDSKILQNYIYDIKKSSSAGQNPVVGVYLDGGTGHFIITDNILENIDASVLPYFINESALDNVLTMGLNDICKDFAPYGVPLFDTSWVLKDCPVMGPDPNNNVFNKHDQSGIAAVIKLASGIEPAYRDILQPPQSIVVVSGTPQSTTAGTAFGSPLQAKVTDVSANPLAGVVVTFTAPSNGASATFSGNNVVTATTNASGIATSLTPVANNTAGTYNVTASVSGLTPATFTLTNTPATSGVTIFGNADTSSATFSTGSPVELGVKFRSDVNGTVTGVRFLKDAQDTTVHTGSLWSSTGQLLATGTFSGGSASGWQQLNFSSPVNITAGTIYVVSYHTGGPFLRTLSFFANSAYDNPPLHALKDGAAGGNGLYIYGNGGQFPNLSFGASNYWADVAFTPSGGGTPNSIVAFSGTPQSTTVGTAFGIPLQAKVTDASSNPLAGVVVTFTAPSNGASATFSGNNLVTATTNASGIATSLTPVANNTAGTYNVTASVSGLTPATFTLTNTPATSGVTIFGNADTSSATFGTGSPVELGVKFQSDVNGTVTGVRFLKDAQDTTVHTGSLWSSTGQLLATGTFSGGTASGWQQLNFTAPVNITAGTIYVVSYHTGGPFLRTLSFFANSAYDNPPLHALKDGAAGGNGLYIYGNGGQFPNLSFGGSNYWADVVVTPSGGGTPNSIVAFSGTPQSTTVGTAFGIPLQAKVTDASSNPLAGVVVTFTAPSNGASATFSGNNLVTATTNTSGIATSLTPVANNTAGTYNVTASVSGLTPATFTLTNTPATSGVTIFGNADTSSATFSTGSPVELGVKFRSDVNGTVTGVRFLKDAQDTTVHTGSLWSSTGQLLATGTFSGGPASGWQQLNFSSPVPILANTTYIVSYHTGGPFLRTLAFFANSAYDNPPLHALKDGAVGGNGLYIYGDGGQFPNLSYQASNYWADVVFTPSGGGTPNSIVAFSGTPQSTTAGTAFGSPLQAKVTDASSNPLAGVGVTFTAPSNGASATFSGNNLVTATTNASGIATSPTPVANNTAGTYNVTASVSGLTPATFTLTNTPTTSGVTIFGNADTSSATFSTGSPVELGVKFRSDVNGTVTGVRFLKDAQDATVHTGSLWASTGQLLATGTFSVGPASGWQQLNFSSPVPILANTTYIVSYHTGGPYLRTLAFFANSAYDNPPLHALKDGVVGGNGVYIYGNGEQFPNLTFGGSNYWADVVFVPNQ